jgi:cyclopropane-fatty-acyl-phospholipid synthase
VYLAGMAYAFDHGWLSVAQVLSFKPSIGGEVRRPWTREYQYQDPALPAESKPVQFAGKLDWT